MCMEKEEKERIMPSLVATTDASPGCLFPHGPAGITHRKSEEGYRKYRMKIMHFGANLKVDHLGSNHQA